MASNFLQVLLNFPRSELKKVGWSKSRLASAMQPAVKQTIVWGTFGGTETKHIKAPLPDKLWREPNSGVIMMKPNVLKADYWEDASNDGTKIPLSSFNVGDPTNYLGLPVNSTLFQTGAIHTQRNTASAGDIVGGLASAAESAINSQLETEMVWCMKTNFSLYENEGFSVWVHPPGIFTDRATDYMLVSFGGRYILHLRMNGTASLWTNINYFSSGTPTWVERAHFNFAHGGVDHNKPFQVTIIPWGFSYLTLMFSQTYASKQLLSVGARSSTAQTVFLYDIQASEGFFPEFDNIANQYIKTYSAPIGVALRRYLFQYGLAWARVRYPSGSVAMPTMPETLPEPLSTMDPTIVYRGFANSGSIVTSILDDDGTAWDKAVDTSLVVTYTFTAAGSLVYTPELWSVDETIDPLVFTPNWTPIDVSTLWSYVRFQRSITDDVSTCELKFQSNARDFTHMFHGWGPIRINYDGVPVFDGYIYERNPTVEDYNAKVLSQVSARDMWLRLNEQYVPDYRFLDGLNLLDVLKELVKRAGFTDSDITVTDTGSYLASLSFDGFVDPNDQKAINPDSSVGDILREIIRGYSLLPIRVRPANGKWLIYLAPQFVAGSKPTKKFYVGNKPADTSDATRFAAHQYYITGHLEFSIEEPEFNGLIARAATGTEEGAEALQALVPAVYADPASVTDDTSFWFQGHAKVKIVYPPEIPSCVTQGELEKAARVYWERKRRKRPVLEFRGEWQPEIDVDDFIWVLGVDQSKANVSYGAYRIDSIDVEVTWDPGDPLAGNTFTSHSNGRWMTECSYTAVYVGAVTDTGIPMFTTVLPT